MLRRLLYPAFLWPLLAATARCTVLVDTAGLDVGRDPIADAHDAADAGGDPDVTTGPSSDATAQRDGGILWPGNGHVYLFVVASEELSWTSARDRAVALGGHLVTLTTEAENQFVFDAVIPAGFFKPGEAGPWIGAYQTPPSAAPRDGWAWVTGEPWSFTAWAKGSPDDNGGKSPESVAHFYFEGSPSPAWNDGPPVAGTEAFIVEFE